MIVAAVLALILFLSELQLRFQKKTGDIAEDSVSSAMTTSRYAVVLFVVIPLIVNIAAYFTPSVGSIEFFFGLHLIWTHLVAIFWAIISMTKYSWYGDLPPGIWYTNVTLAWALVGSLPLMAFTLLVMRHFGKIISYPIAFVILIFFVLATHGADAPDIEGYWLIQVVSGWTSGLGVPGDQVGDWDGSISASGEIYLGWLRLASAIAIMFGVALLLFGINMRSARTIGVAILLVVVAWFVFRNQVGPAHADAIIEKLVTLPASDDSITSEAVITVDGVVQKKEWKPDYVPYASSRPGKAGKSFILLIALLIMGGITFLIIRKKE